MADIGVVYTVADDSVIIVRNETRMMFISPSHSLQAAGRVDYKILHKARCRNIKKEASGSLPVT